MTFRRGNKNLRILLLIFSSKLLEEILNLLWRGGKIKRFILLRKEKSNLSNS